MYLIVYLHVIATFFKIQHYWHLDTEMFLLIFIFLEGKYLPINIDFIHISPFPSRFGNWGNSWLLWRFINCGTYSDGAPCGFNPSWYPVAGMEKTLIWCSSCGLTMCCSRAISGLIKPSSMSCCPGWDLALQGQTWHFDKIFVQLNFSPFVKGKYCQSILESWHVTIDQ